MSDVGATNDITSINLTFDDAAAAAAPDSTLLLSGNYQPSNYDTEDVFVAPMPAGVYTTNLGNFAGLNPNGIWSLYVVDDAAGDQGIIADGWSLTFSVKGPRGIVSISNPVATSIPSFGPASLYPINLSVSGLSGTIANVTVRLNGMDHTYPGDLDILLVGPAGQSTILMSDAGGTFDLVNADLTFDDAALALLPESLQITNGVYKPTNYGTSDTFLAPAPTGPWGESD